MQPLAHKVLDHIRRLEFLKPGDRVAVAVSGGADSVALLRLLLALRSELGIVISVVHFNHKLRDADSDQDEAFVAALSREHKLEFHTSSADVKAESTARSLSVEAAARELRYGFFKQLVLPDAEGHSQLDKVATGHTLDDQAETVLLRVIRGTGMRGLAGIYPWVDLEDDEEIIGQVIRPLLAVRHLELTQYLNEIGQAWREDSSNRDPKFTRNRVRQVLLPLLEQEFNPSMAAGLSELAEIARGEEDYWQNEVAGWMGTAIHWSEPEWARSGQQGLVQLQPFNPELQARLREPGPLVMNVTVRSFVAAIGASRSTKKSSKGDWRIGGLSPGIQTRGRDPAFRSRGRRLWQAIVAAAGMVRASGTCFPHLPHSRPAYCGTHASQF